MVSDLSAKHMIVMIEAVTNVYKKELVGKEMNLEQHGFVIVKIIKYIMCGIVNMVGCQDYIILLLKLNI